jgi:hypothetical protein
VGDELYQVVTSLFGEDHTARKRATDPYSKEYYQYYCNYDIMSIKAPHGHTGKIGRLRMKPLVKGYLPFPLAKGWVLVKICNKGKKICKICGCKNPIDKWG